MSKQQATIALHAGDLEGFEAALRACPQLMLSSSGLCVFRQIINSRDVPVVFLERFFDIAEEHGYSVDAIVHQAYNDSSGGAILTIIGRKGYTRWVTPIVNRCPSALQQCDMKGLFPIFMAAWWGNMDTFHEMAQHVARMHPTAGKTILLGRDDRGYGLYHAIAKTESPHWSFKSYLQLGFLLNVSHSDLCNMVITDGPTLKMEMEWKHESSGQMSETEVMKFRYEVYFERSLVSWLCACI